MWYFRLDRSRTTHLEVSAEHPGPGELHRRVEPVVEWALGLRHGVRGDMRLSEKGQHGRTDVQPPRKLSPRYAEFARTHGIMMVNSVDAA